MYFFIKSTADVTYTSHTLHIWTLMNWISDRLILNSFELTVTCRENDTDTGL